MNNLLTAIYGKFAGSALSTAVGGRIFLDQAPDNCEFPYIVFFIVSANQEKTFTENMTNTLIQFSLFSASESAVEITGMYANLTALLDECSLTITGATLVWMREQNVTTMIEDITVADASQKVKHWAVDYDVKTSLN